MVKNGSRRHEIEIMTLAKSESSGFPDVSESLYVRTMAFIKQKPGKELGEDDQVVSVTETTFNIHWLERVSDQMRIKWNDGISTRYFRIIDVINVNEMNRELNIVCVEMPYQEQAR